RPSPHTLTVPDHDALTAMTYRRALLLPADISILDLGSDCAFAFSTLYSTYP
ncbi:hypothetical protein HPB47_012112, partial [Ixodes persulcatus]